MSTYNTNYSKCTEKQKDILQLFALCNNESITKTNFLVLLRKAKSKDYNDKAYASPGLSKELFTLHELRLLKNDIPLVINGEKFKNFLIVEAFKNKKIDNFITGIREFYPLEEKTYRGLIIVNNRLERELKISLLQKNSENFHKYFNILRSELGVKDFVMFFRDFIETNELLALQSHSVQFEIIASFVSIGYFNFEDFTNYIPYLKKIIKKATGDNLLRSENILIDLYILQGKIQEAQKIIDKYPQDYFFAAQAAAIQFIKGDNYKAIKLYETALKLLRKVTRNKKKYFSFFSGIFYIPALFQTNASLSEVFSFLKEAKKTNYAGIYTAFGAVAFTLDNDTAKRNATFKEIKEDYDNLLTDFFVLHAKHWSSMPVDIIEKQRLVDLIRKANKNEYNYFAVQGAKLLLKLNYQKINHINNSRKIIANSNIKTNLYDIVPKVEPWERIINSLINLNNPNAKKSREKSDERVVWLIDIKNSNIQPKLQVRNKKGEWTKGRNIALKKLKSYDLDCMTAKDREIANTIYKETSDGYWGSVDYYIDEEKALLAMASHPNLFLFKNPSVRIELRKASPELIIKKKSAGYSLGFSISCKTTGVEIQKETETKYKIVEITEAHKSIYNTFGKNKIVVPERGKEKLQKVISNLSSILTIQSDLKNTDTSLKEVKADSKIHVQLLPYNEGIKAELFVKPFKTAPPYLKPGKGGKNIISEIRNRKVKTSRNLTKEKEKALFVFNSCPEFRTVASYKDIYITEDSQDALQLLMELERIKSKLVIEWPQGERFKIHKEVSHENMFMKIKHNADWFEISGELKIDKNLVWDIKELLEKLKNKPANFIELKDGEFIALSDKFRQHLEELNSYSEQTKKSIRIHPLAAQAIEGLTDNVKFKADKEWIAQKERLAKAQTVKPVIPSTLQAELRDYQVVGYNWLSQLAAWGVGACLADDMGLGKTMQSIAILLQRASDGFALIVAPASVARNWLAEIQKFAPTLNPIIFRTGNRKEKLDKLKPFDVLISSYGLLQSESEMLSEIKWNTVILDEAQAIKNHNTKTSKAAMLLKSDFKLITTGTPVQNHLGELWNLFNFINKGLLGSAEQFNLRYVANTEPEARKKLKKLIQPFILRRTKTQVLDELPKKTEVTINIDLSKDEIAFYEAIRQKAIEELESDERPDSHKQFQILAEISKLRQACCHPQLVVKDSKIKSSKTEVFMELLRDIIEGGHKVLVFSQFVKFLTIVRKELDQNNISYKYLDGSTPIKKREQNINEFQSGEGDVFLISLRAGGLGLNLTAADYVIHLDPWWNPAVEDQASDRAHRIGQTRPVTVYRLVTKGAIEEQILKLHKSKRKLADNLLDGTDTTGKMNATELLKLIKF